MKRKSLQIGIASLIATVILGCSHKSDHNASKEMIQKSQKHFADQLNTLKQYGFDINTANANSYILTIKDPDKVSTQILSLAGMTAIDQKTKKDLDKILDGSKIGIKIDWVKYTNMDANSTFVYFLGNKQTNGAFENKLKSKKIGAYIGFGKDNTIKTVFFKDINEKENRDHLQIKSLKAITKDGPSNAFEIDAKKISFGFVQNGSTPTDITFEKLSCNANMQNRYLGKYSCILPKISLNINASSGNSNAIFNDTSIDYNTNSKNNKLSTTTNIKIKDTKLDLKNGYTDATIKLNLIKLKLNSNDVNASIIKEMTRVSKKERDLNKSNIKMAELLGNIFKYLKLDYDLSLDSAKIVSKGTKNSKQIDIKKFREKGDLSFDQMINTNDITTLSSIYLNDSLYPAPIFEIKNLNLATGIRGLYNFLPELIEIVAKNPSIGTQNGAKLTNIDTMRLIRLAKHVTNNGISIYVKPLRANKLLSNGKTYDKINFNLDIDLTKNSIDPTTPMAKILLLEHIASKGKLVVDKNYLDVLSKNLSPSVIFMLIMYVKYDNNNAIFDFEFKNGHLLINNKLLI